MQKVVGSGSRTAIINQLFNQSLSKLRHKLLSLFLPIFSRIYSRQNLLLLRHGNSPGPLQSPDSVYFPTGSRLHSSLPLGFSLSYELFLCSVLTQDSKAYDCVPGLSPISFSVYSYSLGELGNLPLLLIPTLNPNSRFAPTLVSSRDTWCLTTVWSWTGSNL